MSGISQEFTTFGLKDSKSGKFLTYTRYEIPLLKIVFKLKHESYIISKFFKVKVLSVFRFDAFLPIKCPLVDLQKSLSWNFRFYVPGLISFGQGI